MTGFLRWLVGNLGTRRGELLYSRVSLLLTGDTNVHDQGFEYSSREDETACLLTLAAVIIGLLAFNHTYHISLRDKEIMLASLFPGIAHASPFEIAKQLLYVSLAGLGASACSLFLSARVPSLGYAITHALFVTTLACLGFVAMNVWVALGITLALTGGIIAWSYEMVRSRLAGPVRALGYICLIATSAALFMTSHDAFTIWRDWTIGAKIIVPFIGALSILLVTLVLGRLLQVTTSASSSQLSPCTTAGYALGIVSATIWMYFIQFALRAVFRRRRVVPN